MSLKTLKDLDESNGKTELWSHHSHLRMEAIKWIKSKNTGGFSFSLDFEGKVSRHHHKKENLNSIDYANLGEMIGFINFFNITENDLNQIGGKK